MANVRPRVLLACNRHVHDNYLAARDRERLDAFADWEWFACEGGGLGARHLHRGHHQRFLLSGSGVGPGSHPHFPAQCRRLITFLRPFETEVWVYDPYLPREMADAVGFLETSLDNVLSRCDAIVCVAPRTEGLIGRRELDLIPAGAMLVNVSRGKIIDTQALVERLKRGDIVAGLDVLDPEVNDPSYAAHEITQLDNVFLSPHVAGVTAACYPRFFALMVDDLDRFFHGHETRFDLTPRTMANRRGTEPHA